MTDRTSAQKRESGAYESAVKGRSDFRAVYRTEREKNKRLVEALRIADEAINPPDRGGISLDKWNQRLKAATKVIRHALSGASRP